ncbi:MAG: formate/nitrite transporter family protein [Gaiellaceae bacterium]
MGVPQPEQIYELTKEEGSRRLQRPFLEMAATAIAAGFDVVVGVTVLVLIESQLEHDLGRHAAHVFGALGFGVGFVFLVVGRGELFTENFLVPLAGIEGKQRNAWLKLAELWTISPIFNIAAGALMVVLVSVHSVLPYGSGTTAIRTAEVIHSNGWLPLFVSAIVAGALITAMTWFVEGQRSIGVRVVVAWIAAAILALGTFNHAIVVTIEQIYGIRYGAKIPWTFVLENFGVAAAGNMIGGIGLVTVTRFTQARSAGKAASG